MANLSKSSLHILLLLVGLFVSANTLAAKAIPFQATYDLTFNGQLVGKAQFELKLDGDSYHFEAVTLPAGKMAREERHEILEISEGRIENGLVIPNAYRYALFSGEKIKGVSIKFDWTNNQLLVQDNDSEKTLALAAYTQDHLSYLLQTGISQADHLKFPITELESTGDAHIKALGKALLKLPYAQLYAMAFTRVSAEDNVSRTLWFASSTGIVPVQIDRAWPKGRSSMRLKELNLQQQD